MSRWIICRPPFVIYLAEFYPGEFNNSTPTPLSRRMGGWRKTASTAHSILATQSPDAMFAMNRPIECADSNGPWTTPIKLAMLLRE